jgi:O-antigen/teichoic acid export membrane protein
MLPQVPKHFEDPGGLRRLRPGEIGNNSSASIPLAIVISPVGRQLENPALSLILAVLGVGYYWAAPVRFVLPAFCEIRKLLRDGWQVFGSLFLVNSCSASNVVILGMLASPEQVGIYSAASRIIFPLRQTVGPLVNAVYPHVSRLASQAPERAMRFLRRYSFLLSLPFLLVAAGIVIFAPLAVRLLYGPRYAETALLLQIMGISPWVLSLGHCYSTFFLLAFGHERDWARITAAGVLFNFVALGAFLLLGRPAMAVSMTLVATDVFVLFLSYRRYASRRAEWVPSPDDRITR